jgi:ABC-type lipopolysaccharide export system ATPase subunit
MKHILEADSIQLAFDNRNILSDIYIKSETGKITALLGRNGQGKTCLMQIIYGSLECEKSVRFDNVPNQNAYKKPELIKYLPQFNFIPKQRSLTRIFSDFELDYFEFEKKFPEFISKHKLSFGVFSGGEKRLIELYVIVKSKSHFAILDEPFSHLNPIQIEKIKALLNEEKSNKGLLITDHMFNHVTEIADNIYVLANGKTHLINDLKEIEALGYARV